MRIISNRYAESRIIDCISKVYQIIILWYLATMVFVQPNGRRVIGEDTDAQANLGLGSGSVRIKINKDSSPQIPLISIKNVIHIG